MEHHKNDEKEGVKGVFVINDYDFDCFNYYFREKSSKRRIH